MPTDTARMREAPAETAADHGPGLVGLVGLVTEHGATVFEAGIGATDLDSGRPPTADDPGLVPGGDELTALA